MPSESELWEFVLDHVRDGSRVIFLTVAESSGSSPGRAGFKMAVAEDQMIGSIGGGVMEVALVDRARRALADRSGIQPLKSEIVKLVHRPNAIDASGMICSGSQTVIVCELDGRDLETILEISRSFGESRLIGIRIANDGISIVESSASGGIVFRDDGGPPEGGTPSEGSTSKFVYEETLGRKPTLFIVGGGHCALALSELVSKLGFHIELFDDRRDLNTIEKNVFVNRKTMIESYDAIGGMIDSGADQYVVVMTLGYKFDEIVIRRLFDKDFKYFGVLGSKAKMGVLLNSLKKEGFDSARLERIRTPVGVSINSRTPEEIAVSIAAEIIAVKNA